MLPIGTLLLLSAVAGLLGLDSTGVLQIMVSRPLVVGGVFGLLMGETAVGLTVGSLVEMISVGDVAVGSVVPPDGAAAAAMAVAVAVRLAGISSPAAAAAVGILASVPAGFFGSRAEVVQRVLTNRLSRRADARMDAGKLSGVGGLLAAAVGLAWLRGALVCAVCLGLGLPALGWILGHVPPAGVRALRWCFWLFWLLGMAVAANHFWNRRGLKYAAGVALVLAVCGAQFGLGQGKLLALAVVLAVAAGLWRWMGARRGELA